jgi:hypothetical protein
VGIAVSNTPDIFNSSSTMTILIFFMFVAEQNHPAICHSPVK